MPNLQITLNKSTCLISLFCSLYGLVFAILIAAAWLLWLPISGILALFLLSIISFYRAIRFLGQRSHSQAICQINWNRQNGWTLQNNQGEQWVARLCGDSFITSFILLLHFKTNSRRFFIPVIITPRCINKELYRRLCVLTMIIQDK